MLDSWGDAHHATRESRWHACASSGGSAGSSSCKLFRLPRLPPKLPLLPAVLLHALPVLLCFLVAAHAARPS